MQKPEKKCPECGGPIKWKTVHNSWGAPAYNGLCTKCNIIFRHRETPYVTRGKNLEAFGEIDGTLVKEMDAMDRKITKLPCDVQIGILRQRQHADEL